MSSEQANMIILGCGYLGTGLARATLAAGGRVSALTRNAARGDELRALGVPVVVADLASDDWHAALNPAGASVVNCVSPSSSGEEGYRHAFVEGMKSLVRWLGKSAAAGHAPARDALFTSSTGVYPQADGGWVAEDAAVGAATLSPAGTLLREAEDCLLAQPVRLVRRTWVLRLAGLYGPGRHHLLDALRSGERRFPGNEEGWMNLLHRDDALAAIRACLDAPASMAGDVFNVADNEPVRRRDLLAWLAGEIGLDPALVRFEPGASSRTRHRRNAAGEAPHRRIASQRLQERLGWQPGYPSFREGFRQILLDGR